MKNVFTYRDGIPDGNPFVIRQADSALAERKRASDEENERFNRHFNRGELLLVIFSLGMLLGLFGSSWGIECLVTKNYSRTEEYVFAIVFAGVGVAVCLVSLFSFVFLLIREERMKFGDKYSAFRAERRKLLGELLTEMGVAAAGLEKFRTDVFGCRYQTKKGKSQRKPASLKKYLAIDTQLWLENEAFYFFDWYAVYEFPIDDLVKMERITRQVRFYRWNKKISYGHIKYKPYGIRRKLFADKFSIKAYYRLVFAKSGEEYEILIPNYEKQTLEKLTGKTLS